MKRIIAAFKEKWPYYLLESFVITFGILMAFGLNTWNDNRKQEILQIQYLRGLKIDLAADTVYYNRRISDSENVVNNHLEFRNQLYQTQKNSDDIKRLWSYWDVNSEHLTTQNSTYVELTNSGNLNIISNQSLKQSLITYYRENERIATHIKEFNEYTVQMLVSSGEIVPISIRGVMPHSLNLEPNPSQWSFLNEPSSEKFQVIDYTVTVYQAKHKVFLAYFKSLKERAIELQNDIQHELHSRKIAGLEVH